MMLNAKHKRYTAFLVAVTERAADEADVAVYAAMKRSAEEAISEVQSVFGPAARVAIVGNLSASVSKALKLKRDEIRGV